MPPRALLSGLSFLLTVPAFVTAQIGQAQHLPGTSIAQFVDPLPVLHVTSATDLTLVMTEFQSPVMPTGFQPATGTYTGTWVWGYRDLAGQTSSSYINPVVLATRNVATTIRWRNDLPGTTTSHLVYWRNSVDSTLHWADPHGMGHGMGQYSGPVPAVPHLHGGEIPPTIDGGPEAWFTDFTTHEHHGSAYYSLAGAAPDEAIYRYPNQQEAADLWFHDHALGLTRLNVYAGLTGVYLLKDPAQPLPAGLTAYGIGTETIVPLVLQDRKFDVNGQLYFDNEGINPDMHPYWIPEFVGDTIVVNGKVWPTFGTANAPKPSKRYRFLFLNASNARPYALNLVDAVTGVQGPPLWVIGTDGGYLDRPARLDPSQPNGKLVLMPGERYDVIVDFNDPAWRAANPQFSGRLLLRNSARTPFPAGEPVHGTTTARVLKLFIGAPVADTGYDPASAIALRAPMVRLVNPTAGTAAVTPSLVRQLTLNEVMGPGGPMEVLVNNTHWNGKSIATDLFPGGVRPDSQLDPTGSSSNYLTELPPEGSIEQWEIVNVTADAHPLHLHLVQFQLMNRQRFQAHDCVDDYESLFPPTAVPDPMTGLPYPGQEFVGGFGPPMQYVTGNPNKLGGNPEVDSYLIGPRKPPGSWEAGWKDTVIVYPGEVTRLMVRWAPTSMPANTPLAQRWYPFDPDDGGCYVFHCHILDHEDNEMMRPYVCVSNPAAPATALRPLVRGVHF